MEEEQKQPVAQEQHFTVSGGPETLTEVKQKEVAADILFPEQQVTAQQNQTESSEHKVTNPVSSDRGYEKVMQMPKVVILVTLILFAFALIFKITNNKELYTWVMGSVYTINLASAVVVPLILFVSMFFVANNRGKIFVVSILFFLGAIIVGFGSCFFAYM
jgi:hypothetical protein